MSKIPPLISNPQVEKNALVSFLGKAANLVNQLMKGASNTVGTVTLASGGATQTTLKDANITANCSLWFTATTAHAGAITGFWADPTSIVTGESAAITLNHSANSTTDATFWYEIRV